MSNVAIAFGVMGKSLGLLPDAVAAHASFNVIENQNQSKITTRRNENCGNVGSFDGLVQKIEDCGEDYQSWPEKTGLQAANDTVGGGDSFPAPGALQ
jgi:hypothetical protein